MLPSFQPVVWILVLGRVLLQLGTGFVLFYAAIYFVNEVGVSATAMGVAVGLGQVAGIGGRILSGSMADSPRWGRRKTLLLSAAFSAIADIFLFSAQGLPLLIVGNALMGLGIGFYWPAMEALVADVTPADHRRDAYALTRLSDALGLGIGVVLGGIVVAQTGGYRWLFVFDGVSFLVFGAVLYFAVADRPVPPAPEGQGRLAGWGRAIADPVLQVFVVINTAFTVYMSQLDSTMPLYLRNVAGSAAYPIAEREISILFTWHIVVVIVTQLPVARLLRPLSHTQALTSASGLFAIGFVGLWWTGQPQNAPNAMGWAIAALGILSVAMATYTPAGSSLVADIAPESLRGTYLSINSLCWAVGYTIGPPLGGLALDQAAGTARVYWLGLAASTLFGVAVLRLLSWRMKRAAAEDC
ncbi:MAG: MFS transporter [Cyanophyceae cyanobacterium]